MCSNARKTTWINFVEENNLCFPRCHWQVSEQVPFDRLVVLVGRQANTILTTLGVVVSRVGAVGTKFLGGLRNILSMVVK